MSGGGRYPRWTPGIELRDWSAYDAAVEAGYVAAKAALESSEIPKLCCPA